MLKALQAPGRLFFRPVSSGAPLDRETPAPDAPRTAPLPGPKRRRPTKTVVAALIGAGAFFLGANVSQHQGVPLELIPGAQAAYVAEAADAAAKIPMKERRETLERELLTIDDAIANGTPGGQLAVDSAQRLVDHYRDDPRLSDRERFDHVLTDLMALHVGHRFTQTVEGTPFFSGAPMTQAIAEYVGHMNAAIPGGLNGTIDPTDGADLKGEYQDGGNNQLVHILFYVGLAYGEDDTRLSKLGAVQHEVIDPWGAWGDLRSGLAGSDLGKTLRTIRDEGRTGAYDALPIVFAGFLLEDASAHGDAAVAIADHFEAREVGDGFIEGLWRAIHFLPPRH
ncbi:MAG: hypothetical protein RMA76_15540 [Deltaproteobacteria bacterium]|jgi:hypothetical protein